MHSRKLRHDDTSAKNVTQYVGYALVSSQQNNLKIDPPPICSTDLITPPPFHVRTPRHVHVTLTEHRTPPYTFATTYGLEYQRNAYRYNNEHFTYPTTTTTTTDTDDDNDDGGKARPMNRLGQGIIVGRKLTNRVMDKMSKGIGNHHSKKQHNKEQDKQHSLWCGCCVVLRSCCCCPVVVVALFRLWCGCCCHVVSLLIVVLCCC